MSDITEKHIQLILDGLYMADRCRIQILHSGSISIGFGSMVHHGNAKLRDTYYGEWEIGSFHNAWRLVSGSRVLCTGDTDEYQAQISESELEKNLSKRIRRVYNLSTLDVRVDFGSGVCLDFLSVGDAEDESFHIFCPNEQWLAFTPNRGWLLGTDPLH
jgi:hypothetical protein